MEKLVNYVKSSNQVQLSPASGVLQLSGRVRQVSIAANHSPSHHCMFYVTVARVSVEGRLFHVAHPHLVQCS